MLADMRSVWKPAGAALAAPALALLLAAAACGGGSGAGSPTPEPGEKQSSTAAIVAYVTGGRLGRAYAMAEPAGCDASRDALQARGKVCIYFATGDFSDTEGTIEVLRLGEGERWELRLELQGDLSWRVTGASRLAGE
jgi:hypothetical protein